MSARQCQHGLAVLSHERILDLGFATTFGDQAPNERSLAVRLWGLGDVERDLAGDAHHLAFDRRQACTWGWRACTWGWQACTWGWRACMWGWRACMWGRRARARGRRACGGSGGIH